MRTRSKGQLRVEMVLPCLGIAGMERVVARLSRMLCERNYSVGVTCVDFEGALAPELRASGVRVVRVPAAGLRSFFQPIALRRWFEETAPDIVHVHNVPWFKAAVAARQAGVPRFVFSLHGRDESENWVDRVLDRRAARFSNAITAVSSSLRDHLIQSLRLDSEQVVTVANGVDTGEFRPNVAAGKELRSRLGLGMDQPLIGMIARLEPIKNHDCLLRSFVKVASDHPTARLLLVGDGQLRGALKQRIAEYGLVGSVLMTGERSDVADVYRALDVCVLPSLAEGASMTILEAMASGVCIVASEVGGTPELLDHGSCGLLVARSDANALSQAIDEVIRDHELRRNLAKAARRRCLEHYSIAQTLLSYERIYLGHANIEALKTSSLSSDPSAN